VGRDLQWRPSSLSVFAFHGATPVLAHMRGKARKRRRSQRRPSFYPRAPATPTPIPPVTREIVATAWPHERDERPDTLTPFISGTGRASFPQRRYLKTGAQSSACDFRERNGRARDRRAGPTCRRSASGGWSARTSWVVVGRFGKIGPTRRSLVLSFFIFPFCFLFISIFESQI
jgi:hypothetical protein